MNRVQLKIKDLFKLLEIDNTQYETVQTSTEKIFIKTPDNNLVPILGYVKKQNNVILNVILEDGMSFKCSENHLVICDDSPTLVKNADFVLTKDGYKGVVSKHQVSVSDVYDISIPSPHLYITPNGVIHHNTSLSRIIINDVLECDSLYINASDENGIDTIRGKIVGFARTKSFNGRLKVILLDEVDGLSGEGMKALRNVMEEYADTCRFQMTCNYLFKVIEAIRSRCTIINLIPPIEGVVQRVSDILKKENVVVNSNQKPLLLEHIRKNLPDLRRIINDIQKFSITGTLDIKSDNCSEFAKSIVAKLLCKEDMMKLRKEIIEGERFFSSDYRHLMKLIFEELFNHNMKGEQKGDILLRLAEGMEKDAIVIDKEINFFATMLSLSRNIS